MMTRNNSLIQHIEFVFAASVVLLLACVLSANAQTNGMTMIGHVNLPHGVSPDQTSFASCWGWTSSTGKEYAFLSTYTGMAVFDMNVDPPEEIQFVPGPASRYC